jgi:hypothetical protein
LAAKVPFADFVWVGELMARFPHLRFNINANPWLQRLLITKQQELYSSVCAIVPPLVRILPHSEDGGWKFKSFEWAPCSSRGADATGIQDFLKYRNAKMEKIGEFADRTQR